MKINTDQKLPDLIAALTAVDNSNDMLNVLKDLTTPAELTALADRWVIARLLHQGDMSYREIAEATGASTTTVTRVARFLSDEPHHGYKKLLELSE